MNKWRKRKQLALMHFQSVSHEKVIALLANANDELHEHWPQSIHSRTSTFNFSELKFSFSPSS